MKTERVKQIRQRFVSYQMNAIIKLMFKCVVAPNTLHQMKHLWHEDTFTDVFFVLTFLCGKFYLISGWNQLRIERVKALNKLHWSYYGHRRLWNVLTVAPVSCLGIGFFAFISTFPRWKRELSHIIYRSKRKTFCPCRNSWIVPDITSTVIAGCIMCQQGAAIRNKWNS
jgi:hypothetical protein